MKPRRVAAAAMRAAEPVKDLGAREAAEALVEEARLANSAASRAEQRQGPSARR
jgi:hypothetical protein